MSITAPLISTQNVYPDTFVRKLIRLFYTEEAYVKT